MARKRYHKPRRSHIVTPVPSENRIRTERTSDPNNKAAEQIREGAPAIWVKKGNGTTGPVSAQTLSMSQLLRWRSNLFVCVHEHSMPRAPLCRKWGGLVTLALR